MTFTLPDWFPTIALPFETQIIILAFFTSLIIALGALIKNRRLIRIDDEAGGDMGAIFDNPSAIMPHIVELRQRLILSFAGILVGTLVAAILTEQILVVLAEPIGGLTALQAIRVTESVTVFLRVAITLGIILASPFVIAQVWIFIAAGLKKKERRVFYLLFPFALFLFLAGVTFAYFVMLPVAVPFLTSFMGIQALPTLEDYIKFVTSVMLWVGISFEMPLVLFGLAKAKIVNTKMLIQNWRIAVVLIAILSAVITPTPDPVNMGIVSAPLIVLYLLSIILTLFA